jgi:hypothetical protein
VQARGAPERFRAIQTYRAAWLISLHHFIGKLFESGMLNETERNFWKVSSYWLQAL